MTSAALLALLKEARWALDGALPLDDTDYPNLIPRIDTAIREHEAAPERKCGTCNNWAPPNSEHVPPHGVAFWCTRSMADWFCADWQSRGGKDE